MAAKVIGSDVNTCADLIAGREPTKANPSIVKGKTVGHFVTWLRKKTGGGGGLLSVSLAAVASCGTLGATARLSRT